MEVARDFPDCNAVAIDRIPMQSMSDLFPVLLLSSLYLPSFSSLPPNCR